MLVLQELYIEEIFAASVWVYYLGTEMKHREAVWGKLVKLFQLADILI